jgi:hypothetical protein
MEGLTKNLKTSQKSLECVLSEDIIFTTETPERKEIWPFQKKKFYSVQKKNARCQKSFFEMTSSHSIFEFELKKWKFLKEDILKFIVMKFFIFFHENFL